MAKKRKRAKNGQGTAVLRSDGRWMASFSMLDEYGNKKRKSVYGKNEQEVKEKMEEALKSITEKGTWEDTSKLTYSQWLDMWIEDYKKPFIKVSTLENYGYMIKKHIRPVLGEKTVRSISNTHIQKLISSKVAELEPRTVKLIYTVINDSLKSAKYSGIIKENPAENVKLPKQEQMETKYLTTEEISILLEVAKDSRHYTAILFTIATGLRRGELLGLEWKHINFKNNTVKIEQALTQTKTEGIQIGTVKTKNSNRTIIIDDFLMSELMKHELRQSEYREKLGDIYYKEHDLVFCKEDGNPLTPNAFSDTIKDVMIKAGIKGVTLHGLRHTAATVLLENDVDLKTVSSSLGHSNIGITGNIYAHCTDRMKGKAAEVMKDVLGNCLK